VAGALLDKEMRDHSQHFKRGTKRTHDGKIIAKEIIVLLDDLTELDPISVVVGEFLQGGITCACGQQIDKSGTFLKIFGNHVKNSCHLFKGLRSNFLDLQSDDDFIMPGIEELADFTTKAPTTEDKAIFYVHWKHTIPLLWIKLFVSRNLSYLGIVTKAIYSTRAFGFKRHLTQHKISQTIDQEHEQMIALAVGSPEKIRILEAVGCVLLNVSECSSKNSKMERLPLVGLTEGEIVDVVRTLTTLLRNLAKNAIGKVDPETLMANQKEYVDAELAKSTSLKIGD